MALPVRPHTNNNSAIQATRLSVLFAKSQFISLFRISQFNGKGQNQSRPIKKLMQQLFLR
jgi:hypothetical protein